MEPGKKTGKDSAPVDSYQSPFSTTTSRPDWQRNTQPSYGAAGTSSSSSSRPCLISKALKQFVASPFQQPAMYQQRGLNINPNGALSQKERTSLHKRENGAASLHNSVASLHIRENTNSAATGKKASFNSSVDKAIHNLGVNNKKKRNYDKFIAHADARGKGPAQYPYAKPISVSKDKISLKSGMSLDAAACSVPLSLKDRRIASGVSFPMNSPSPFADKPIASGVSFPMTSPSPFVDDPIASGVSFPETSPSPFADEDGPIASGISFPVASPSPVENKPQEPKLSQDEIKKQLKRLTNKEAARRSRERKHQEYKKLEAEVERRREENAKLANFARVLSDGCMKVDEENKSLMKELIENYGEEAVAEFLAKDLTLDNGEKTTRAATTRKTKTSKTVRK